MPMPASRLGVHLRIPCAIALVAQPVDANRLRRPGLAADALHKTTTPARILQNLLLQSPCKNSTRCHAQCRCPPWRHTCLWQVATRSIARSAKSNKASDARPAPRADPNANGVAAIRLRARRSRPCLRAGRFGKPPMHRQCSTCVGSRWRANPSWPPRACCHLSSRAPAPVIRLRHRRRVRPPLRRASQGKPHQCLVTALASNPATGQWRCARTHHA